MAGRSQTKTNHLNEAFGLDSHLSSVPNVATPAMAIVVANAAVGNSAPVQSATEEQFDQQFDINVKGVFFTVQKTLPLLRDGSPVILTSSGGARKGGAALSIYSATKAAVRSCARSWTTDLKDRKIRVNSLSPGPTDTPIFGKIGLRKEQIVQVHSQLGAQIPLGRLARPEEIAFGYSLFSLRRRFVCHRCGSVCGRGLTQV